MEASEMLSQLPGNPRFLSETQWLSHNRQHISFRSPPVGLFCLNTHQALLARLARQICKTSYLHVAEG